jgi:formimidoylglutamate deiminase
MKVRSFTLRAGATVLGGPVLPGLVNAHSHAFQRAIAGLTERAIAAALFEGALAGGKTATALPLGAIAVGHRADMLVLDAQSSALLGVPGEHLLDALVFSSPDARCQEVFVAGNQAVRQAQAGGDSSALWPQLQQDFVRSMSALWRNDG